MPDYDLEMAKSHIAALTADRDRLQAIVDKLPKTADGVPVVPGIDVVYDRDIERSHLCPLNILACDDGTIEPDGYVKWEDVYSTASAAREAAKAAAKEAKP